jgi:hypothetical protein
VSLFLFAAHFCAVERTGSLINSLASQNPSTTDLLFNPDIIETNLDDAALLDITPLDFETEFDAHYGLLAPEQTVLVHAYSDDSDDRVLAEIQPKYIVMFEPNQDFVRRIEVGNNASRLFDCADAPFSIRYIEVRIRDLVSGSASWFINSAAKSINTLLGSDEKRSRSSG